ncbi:hypothetical protein EWB00_010798 [Schistosoma japonicum]|uniref:Uncharacterized protein n=1 Tax=Schistosoma japonicum TaxID=6182 RepID=A0A4Z2DN49_SCHJA|nr:hypothetical protein EWB00_010798 [Schistosoma japonicum]
MISRVILPQCIVATTHLECRNLMGVGHRVPYVVDVAENWDVATTTDVSSCMMSEGGLVKSPCAGRESNPGRNRGRVA